MLANEYRGSLFWGDSSVWNDLQTNVQPGWQSDSLGESDQVRRSMAKADPELSSKEGRLNMKGNLHFPRHLRQRLLNETALAGCDVDFYFNERRLLYEEHLWPIWKSTNPSKSIFDPDLMYQLCTAEENTQKILVDRGLCYGCEVGCLPPYSIVLYARFLISDGFSLDCKELSEEWAGYQTEVQGLFADCTKELKEEYDPNNPYEISSLCPVGFSALVGESFDETDPLTLTFTSSIYATSGSMQEALYNIVDQFDKGTDELEGAYDTQYEFFNNKFTDSVVGRDMLLACASAFITAAAILVHTKSPFLTSIGLLQIILSFPLSYFVYTLVAGLGFFPFLNFIGVFVVFALGADDIFVAVDKWKNARLDYPDESTEFVASIALPDAAGAMFLTTITTAIAFFGTAICPVAPIKMFAIFCGLLIMFDYLMCCLLVFPALCIYDRKLVSNRSNCCIALCSKKKSNAGDEEAEADTEKESLIRRILTGYYNLLHRFRWFLFVISLGALGAAGYGASTLELPTSAEVRLYGPSVEFEQNYRWRENLLLESLRATGGSETTILFGLLPADTGDQNDPESWSQLKLDDTFDPSSAEAQEFMKSFCPNLFAEDFATLPYEAFTCAFNRFSDWLEEQSQAVLPEPIYTTNCGGATGIPVPTENFHSCIIEWSKFFYEESILSNEGRVRIISFPFISRVRGESPFNDLESEWNLIQSWVDTTAATAPEGVKNFYFSSFTFWWYDTNGQMLSTAYGAAGIALSAAAVVIFFSSRSFVLTLFATITIIYVLCSVTSTLVAMGWTLGFLESICFAILIGVSVDFVIHFCHAYAHKSGVLDRGERTKEALIRMGPSILAAALTTVAAAIIMLFTIIEFFQKFALILFMTMIQATIGSFIVFLTFTDSIGPSNPTYLVDRATECIFGKKDTDESMEKNADEPSDGGSKEGNKTDSSA